MNELDRAKLVALTQETYRQRCEESGVVYEEPSTGLSEVSGNDTTAYVYLSNINGPVGGVWCFRRDWKLIDNFAPLG